MPEQSLTLGEGNTPLIKIEGIYFKCEFRNPTGSHKDRAFARVIKGLKKKGIKEAVLSSSGNAAISAATYCRLAGIQLVVFVSPNINKNKLKVLEDLNCRIIKTKRPLSESVKYSKIYKVNNLRQSTDHEAPLGYESVSSEIIKEGVLPDAVFIPVSSGTAFVGIANGFYKLKYKTALHAVQTEAVHPISDVFDKDFSESSESLADAIVAKYTPREKEILEIIKNTGGSGWVIGNAHMHRARSWLLNHNLDCSYEGAVALAAIWKANKKGYEFQKPVCLLTGKYYDK